MLNITNFPILTIRVKDYNLVAQQPEVLQKLRELTLHPYSGMNHELDSFQRIAKTRTVDCKILMAYQNRKLVGWAFLSKEDSSFHFPHSGRGFKASDGVLFEVYVAPSYRKQGIASKLLKVAQKHASDNLCVAPHDVTSYSFYDKYDSLEYKRI